MDRSFQVTQPDTRAAAEGHAGPAFRAEVEAFLDKALTEDLRAAGRATTGLKSDPAASLAWRVKLHARGWYAPSWPVEHGGAGWRAAQRLYFENACAARDAPILMSSGVRTIGPLIIAEGSPAQQARYLPAILRGEHEWCQGFSEAQAGSDLSALSLRATRDGDDFVLTGSKGGDGLVFLLVEMDRPGINVRPIRFIDGEDETNEVFFDGVRTPVADRIGEVGDGWKAAKRLMAIARSNNTTTGLLRRALRAARRGAAEQGGVDAAVQAQLADMTRRVDEFEALEAHVAAGRMAVDAAPATSALKLLATELHQAITETAIEAAPNSAFAQAKYFATRAATIYSGTSEVHRNILARAIGCP